MTTTLRLIVLPVCLVFLASLVTVLAPVSEGVSDAACEIQQGPCVKALHDGISVEFDIQPKPVASMSNLTFLVTIKKNGKPLENASVTLDLSMPGMRMGRNRPKLTPASNGVYRGTGVIVRCMSGGKTWKADFSITTEGKSMPADFVFEVR